MKRKVLEMQVHAGPTALSVRVRGPDKSLGLSQSAQWHSFLFLLAMIDNYHLHACSKGCPPLSYLFYQTELPF